MSEPLNKTTDFNDKLKLVTKWRNYCMWWAVYYSEQNDIVRSKTFAVKADTYNKAIEIITGESTEHPPGISITRNDIL